MATSVTQTFTPGFRLINGTDLNTAFGQVNAAINAPSASGAVRAQDTATATAGGGDAAFAMGSDGPGIYWGSGAPTIEAPQGSLYLNTTGNSTSTRAFINSDGADTWVAITTAS